MTAARTAGSPSPRRAVLMGRTALSGAVFAGVLVQAAVAVAAPNVAGVISRTSPGVAVASPSATETDITLGKSRTIIDWQSLNLPAGDTLKYVFGGSDWISLNRVNVGSAKINGKLYGCLDASCQQLGGNVWIYARDGVLIGPNARINVGGLLATTSPLNMTDAAFLGGSGPLALDFDFGASSPTASVRIAGGASLHASGSLALIAPQVTTETGSQVSAGGSALFGAASSYKVRFQDGAKGLDLFDFVVPAGGGSGSTTPITLGGSTTAGSVFVAAVSRSDVLGAVISAPGLIVAQSATGAGGDIILAGGAGIEAKAVGAPSGGAVGVRVDGTLIASGAAGADGGRIVLAAHDVTLGSTASLDASGANGGLILAGGDIHGGSDPTQNFYATPLFTAATTTIAQGATLRADGLTGAGGKVVAWSDSDTSFAGFISGRGQTAGGFAEVSGAKLQFTGQADLATVAGPSGLLLLDPQDIVIADTDPNPGVDSFIASGTVSTNLATQDVVITSTANANPAGAGNGDITLGTSPISWSSAHSLSLTATNNIVVNAGPQNTGAGSLNLTAGNQIQFNSSIAVGGSVTVGGPVLLLADTTVAAGAGGTTFTSTVDGTQALTVTGGSALFQGAVGSSAQLTALTATNASLSRNVNTTGAVLLNSATTLAGDVDINAGGSAVTFGGAVDGAHALVVQSASTTFSGAVGGSTPLTSLTASAAQLGGNVTTTGAVTLNGATTLASDVTVHSTTGAVEFTGTVDGAHALTVTAGSTLFDASVGGSTALTSLDTSAATQLGANVTTSGAVTFNGATTLAGDVTVASPGVVTFASTVDGVHALVVNGGSTLFQGAVGGSTALTALTASATQLGANVTTSGAVDLTGATSLTNDVTINSGSASTTFGGALDGAHALTVSAGSTAFQGAVGGSTALTSLNASAAQLGANVTTTGVVTLTGATTLTSDSTVTSNTSSVTFAGAVDGAHALTVSAPSTIFQGAVGGSTALTSLTASATQLGANVTTSGAIDLTGATTLASDATVTSTAGSVTFGGTVNGAHALTVSAPSTIFNGVVGGGTALSSLTASAAQIGGNVTATGAVDFTGATALASNATVTSNTGSVTFGGAVDGAHALTVSAGSSVFDGAIGGSTHLTALTASTAQLGADVTTTGGVTLTGATTLTHDVTIGAGGAVTFASVDSDSTARTLVVKAPGQSISFSGAVGGSSPLAGLGVQGASVSFVSGNQINTLAADLSGGGLTYSGSPFTVGAVGTINGIATAGGAVSLTSSGGITISQPLNAGAGDVSLISTAAISENLAGTVVAHTLNVTAPGATVGLSSTGNAVAQLGTIDTGPFTFVDGADLTLNGAYQVQGAMSVSAVDDASLAHHSLTYGASITGTGVTGDVSLSASGALNFNSGTISIPNGVSLSAGADLNLISGSIATTGTLNLSAGGAIVQTATTLSAGLLNASSGADLGIGVSTGDLGNYTSGGSAAFNAAGALQITGTVSGATNATVTTAAGGDLTLTSTGSVTATSGNVLLQSAGGLSLAGNVTAGQNVTLTANGADAGVGISQTAGTVSSSSSGLVTLTASAGSITQSGAVIDTGGTLTGSATGAVSLTANGAATAPGNGVATMGAFSAGGDFSLVNTGNLALTGVQTLAGHTLTLVSQTGAVTQDLLTGTKIVANVLTGSSATGASFLNPHNQVNTFEAWTNATSGDVGFDDSFGYTAVNLTNHPGNIALTAETGNVTLAAGQIDTGAGTLTIISKTGGVLGDAAMVTAGVLTSSTVAGASFDNASNVIGKALNLSNTGTGDIVVTDSQVLTVDTLTNAVGPTGGGNVRLKTLTGDLALTGAISLTGAPTGNVLTVTSLTGGIGTVGTSPPSAALITAAGLTGQAATAAIFDNSANQIASVTAGGFTTGSGASTANDFKLFDAVNLALNGPVTTTNGDLTIQTSGTITQGSGALTAQASNDVNHAGVSVSGTAVSLLTVSGDSGVGVTASAGSALVQTLNSGRPATSGISAQVQATGGGATVRSATLLGSSGQLLVQATGGTATLGADLSGSAAGLTFVGGLDGQATVKSTSVGDAVVNLASATNSRSGASDGTPALADVEGQAVTIQTQTGLLSVGTATASANNAAITALGGAVSIGSVSGFDVSVASSTDSATVSSAQAGRNLSVSAPGPVYVGSAEAGLNLTVNSSGATAQVEKAQLDGAGALTLNGASAILGAAPGSAATSNDQIIHTIAGSTVDVVASSGAATVNVRGDARLDLVTASGDTAISTVNGALTVAKATAGGNLTLSSMVDGGAPTPTATSGSAAVTLATAGADLSVTTVNAANLANLQAGRDLTVSATNGPVTLSSGTATRNLAVTTTNGSATVTTGVAGQNLQVSTTSGNASVGAATAGGVLTVRAANGSANLFAATLQPGGSALTVSATGGDAFLGAGSGATPTTANAVTVPTTAAVTVTADRDVSVYVPGALTINTLSAGRNATAHAATGDMTVVSGHAGGALTVTADAGAAALRTATLTGTGGASQLTLTGATSATLGYPTGVAGGATPTLTVADVANTDIAFHAGSGDAILNLIGPATITRADSAHGNVTVASNDAFTVAAVGGAQTGLQGAAVGVVSAGPVNIDSAAATGVLTVASTTGAVTLGQAQGANVSVTGLGAVSVSSATATGALAFTSTASSVTLGQGQGASVSVTGLGAVNVSSATATGALTLISSSDAATLGQGQGATVSVTAAKAVNVSSATATGALTIASTSDAVTLGQARGSSVSVAGLGAVNVSSATATGALALISSSDAATLGQGQGASVSVTAAKAVTVSNATATGALTIASTSDAATLGQGQGASVTAMGAGDVTVSSATAAGALTLTSTSGGVTLGQGGGSTVTVTAPKDIVASNVTATGDMTLTSTAGSVSLSSATAGDDIRVNALTGTATLSGLTANGTGPDNEAGGAANADGVGSDLWIEAGTINLAGASSAKANVILRTAGLTVGAPLTAGNQLKIESAAGGLNLGGAADAAHLGLSQASFSNLAAKSVVLYAGDTRTGGKRGDLTISNLQVDGSKIGALTLLAGPSNTVRVTGVIQPLAQSTGAGQTAMTIGMADATSGWTPGSILVTGSIGSASVDANGVGSNVHAFSSVELNANQDVILGTANFIAAIQAAPAEVINVTKLTPPTIALAQASPYQLFLAGGTVTLRANGKLVQQNSSPGGVGAAGLLITNPSIGGAGSANALVLGRTSASSTGVLTPGVIDLFASVTDANGALLTGRIAAASPNIRLEGIVANNNYRVNSCSIGEGASCTPFSTAVVNVEPTRLTEALLLRAQDIDTDTDPTITGAGNEEIWRNPQ